MIYLNDTIKIKQMLMNDWVGFADRFIPQYHNSTIWHIKNHEPLSEDVREAEMNYMRVRNNIHSSTLQRNFSECTTEEIANSKLNRLIGLMKRRPEVCDIIKRVIESD